MDNFEENRRLANERRKIDENRIKYEQKNKLIQRVRSDQTTIMIAALDVFEKGILSNF